MPKISPSAPEEGQVITKDSITGTTSEFERIDFDVDADNIREEGLDRRNFATSVYTTNPFEPVRAQGSAGSDTLLERNKTWKRVEFREDQLFNSELSRYPQISIPWNPELDTHCVIRCSMQVTSRRDFTGLGIRDSDFWDFGLVIVPPGQSMPSLGSTDSFMAGHGAWPYQRVQLAAAFNESCNKGHLNDNESFGYYPIGSAKIPENLANPELRKAAVEINPKLETTVAASESDFDDDYARGEWFQHGYNRYGNWTQSFTLIAQATSLLKRGSKNQINTSNWIESGTAKVFVVYRCNLLDPPEVLYAKEGVTKQNKARACVENFELNYLKYRR